MMRLGARAVVVKLGAAGALALGLLATLLLLSTGRRRGRRSRRFGS